MELPNLSNEINLAKRAAKESGDLLVNNKSEYNQRLNSNSKDTKLKADIESEAIIKSIITEDSSDSFSIPWSGILGGLAVSSLIVLTIRIRENSNRQPKKQKSEVKNRKTESVKLSDVKIEISCPVCSRQLRVPENYQGSVRCPDCSHSFEVGSEDIDEEEVQEEEELIENNNDGKVEISCPECSQSLRIPESYDGSVRCPSCKMIFKSKDG